MTADFVRFVQDAGQDIPTLIGGRLRYGEIDETTIHVRFVTEWGWAVILDSTRPLAGQLQNLELVIKDHREQIHEYVDLRLKGWAYAKMKSEIRNPASPAGGLKSEKVDCGGKN